MYYQYQCKIKAVDLWCLSMYRTYHSFIGVCNIVFGVSVILLTLRFWNRVGDILQALLLLVCLLIPVIQPLGVYLNARARTAVMPQGTELTFEEEGIHVRLDGQSEMLPWKRVRNIAKEPGMLIVFTDASHGYMLTDRVLGNEKEKLYQAVTAHINASRECGNAV